MIVTCPSCSTRYSLNSALLGENGRRMRCANCDHVWDQPAYETGVLELDSVDVTTKMPPRPAPEPQYFEEPLPEPAPEPAMIEEDDAPSIDVSKIMANIQESSSGMSDDDMPSEDDVAAAFADHEDPEPMSSFVESIDDDLVEYDSLDDIPDPDPIPEVFTAPTRGKQPAKKGGGFVKFLIFLIVLLGGAAAGLYFGRAYVVQYYPPANEYYKMIGIQAEDFGAGLAIEGVKSNRRKEGSDDILVITGRVANISDVDRPVPQIRVSLYDAVDKEVQFVLVKPEQLQLSAGTKTNFTAEIRNAVPTARRLEVTFSAEAMMEKEGH